MTKGGIGDIRVVLIELAWSYQNRPGVRGRLLRRQQSRRRRSGSGQYSRHHGAGPTSGAATGGLIGRTREAQSRQSSFGGRSLLSALSLFVSGYGRAWWGKPLRSWCRQIAARRKCQRGRHVQRKSGTRL